MFFNNFSRLKNYKYYFNRGDNMENTLKKNLNYYYDKNNNLCILYNKGECNKTYKLLKKLFPQNEIKVFCGEIIIK